MKYHLIPVLFILFISSLFSQVPDATANFIRPEFPITTTPEFPALCLDRGQPKVSVTCNEDYDTYEWYNKQYNIIERTKSVTLTKTGTWCLTVSGKREGVECTVSKTFEVFDLTDPAQIKQYFENAGFYAIPIWREDIYGFNGSNGNNRENCPLQQISFKEGGTEIFVDASINEALNTFEPFANANSTSVFSSNGCLCYEAKDQLLSLETDFKSGDASIWAHQFFLPESKSGFLFLKGQMPGDASLPIPAQKDHFDAGLFAKILEGNEPEMAMKIIGKNLFLAHPIEGYANETLCSSSLADENVYITPVGIPIKSYGDFTGYFLNEEGDLHGTLIWMKSNTRENEKFQGFKFNNNTFEGYADENTGSIIKDFTSPDISLNAEFAYNFANCESQCDAASIAINSKVFKPDGGLNFGLGKNIIGSETNASLFFIPLALKNEKTICFVTPTKSIIAFQNEGIGCSKLKYFELTYGSFTTEKKYSKNLTSGLLYKFIYENEIYKYDFNSNAYTSGIKVFKGIEPEVSDGVIYGLAVADKTNEGKSQYGFYKLERGNLQIHVNGSGEDYYGKFNEFASSFKAFDNGFKKIAGPVFSPSSSNCPHCPSDITSFVLSQNTEKPWHIYVDKIAQVATVFRNYFGYPDAFPTYETFTIYDPRIQSPYSWNLPKSGSSIKFYWEEHLNEFPELKNYPNLDLTSFYRIYLEKLLEFIQKKEDEFWNNIEKKTADEIVAHLKHEPLFVAENKEFEDKKKVGLITLWKYIDKSPTPSQDHCTAFLHLVVASKSNPSEVLAFLENTIISGHSSINIAQLWFSFNLKFGSNSMNKVMAAVCAIINKSNNLQIYPNINEFMPYEENGITVQPSKILPKLEADIWNIKNAYARFKTGNIVNINDQIEVDYKTIVPMEVVSPIEFNGETINNGVITMPALQALLMANYNTQIALENTGWVALDIGFLYLGVSGVRRAWKIGTFAEKAFGVIEVAGATAAIGAQLASSNIIPANQKRYIQLASILTTLPNFINGFRQTAKVVDELAIIAKNNQGSSAIISAEEEFVEKMIKENNANGNNFGPHLDNPADDAKTLVAIDDPVNGMAKRMANEVEAGAGYACLTGDTPIPTKEGYSLLKDIKENDEVITSANQATKVLSKIKNVVKSLVILTLCTGEQIKASPDHQFITDKDYYISAKDINENTLLINKDKDIISICNVAKKDTTVEVYDLVTENINYSVGNSYLLTGTCILRFLAENKTTYPNLYKGYKALDNAKRARLVEDFLAAKKIGNEIELAKALNKQNGIKAWEVALKHSDIKRLDVSFLTKLSTHLDEFPNLKIDLEDADVFKAYKEFADDKVLSYEILSNVDGNLAILVAQKVANSSSPNFWKFLIKGKYFEKDFLLPKFKARFSQNVPAEYSMLKNKATAEFNINLDEYDLYSQVQLNLPGSVTLPSGRVLDYFVADQVFIKWGKKADGVTDEIKDMVIVENKLSSGTNLTPPQNAGKAANSLTVRSQNATLESAVYGKELPKDFNINVNNKWLKAYDSDNGDVLTNIIKL